MTRFNSTRALRAALAAVIAGTLIAVTGCAELPQASVVKDGPDIGGAISSDYLYYSPAGPSKGESKEDILAGFLNASTGPQNDYAIARQYLTSGFRTKWSPNSQVYVQSGVQQTKFAVDNSATVSLGVSATVDSLGHYTELAAGEKRVLNFRLVQVAGEWRIASAPDAIVMIRPVFDVIFRSYPVYFFDHSLKYLIPDLRWFPARASTATRLVSAILAGPSAWLAPAVIRTVPVNTGLAIDAVTVEKKTAIVNLDQTALNTSRKMRQRFKAQLQKTLTGVNNITRVEVQVAGATQSIRDFTSVNTSTGAYAPVVLTTTDLQQLIGPSGGRLSNATPWIAKYTASDFAVSANETGAAILSPAGVYLGRLDQSSKEPKLVDTRKSLLSPRFDNRGQLWLLGTDGALHIVPPSLKSSWPRLPIHSGQTMRAFAISREGSRLAYLVANKDGVVRLYVAAIRRDEKGAVLGFGAALELNHGVGTPVDIQFSGATGLDVLADVNKQTSNLLQLTIGGDSREISTLDKATRLMISDDGSNVYVLGAKRDVQQYHGYTWTTLVTGVVSAHMVN
jgi:hypothetical protein